MPIGRNTIIDASRRLRNAGVGQIDDGQRLLFRQYFGGAQAC